MEKMKTKGTVRFLIGTLPFAAYKLLPGGSVIRKNGCRPKEWIET